MIRPEQIASLVETAFDVEPNSVLREGGNREICAARYAAWYLMRGHWRLSAGGLGQLVRRDQQLINYGCKIAKQRISEDPEFAERMAHLSATIEFLEMTAASRKSDVLDVAERIKRNPRRAAMSASVYEIAAMASVLVDVWDAAITAEAVLSAININQASLDPSDPDRLAAAAAYQSAFLDQMSAFRNGEQDNG